MKLRDRDIVVLRQVQKMPGEPEHRIGAELFGPAGRPDVKARMTLERLERLKLVKGTWNWSGPTSWKLTVEGEAAIQLPGLEEADGS